MDPQSQPPQGNPGTSPAVQAAIARRQGSQPGNMQQGQGALSQTSPGAAMANPTPQMPQNAAENKQSAPQVAPTPPYKPQNQQDMIVEALIEQMHNSTKMQKDQMKIGMQPTPAIPQPSMGALPVAQTAAGQQPSMNPAMPPQAPPGMGAPSMGQGGGSLSGLNYGGGAPGMTGMNDPNFLKPMNSSASANSSALFDYGAPNMSSPSTQQNRYSF